MIHVLSFKIKTKEILHMYDKANPRQVLSWKENDIV